MSAFTVATEACTTTLNWTGAEGSFPAGFPALDPSHISVTYTSGTPPVISLLRRPGHRRLRPGDAARHSCRPRTVTISRHTPGEPADLLQPFELHRRHHTQLADQAEKQLQKLDCCHGSRAWRVARRVSANNLGKRGIAESSQKAASLLG
jgi:hypothetical protein